MHMRRVDWLLLLLALSDSSEPLDPVRLQKGMFLMARENRLSVAERYEFVAYDYGPFSVDIYRDLDALYDAGLVERLQAPGYTWSRYRPTETGIARAQRVVDAMDGRQRKRAVYLQELKQGVLSMSFRALLQHVYSRYPEYGENSVFNG
jgi:uncharacterized protein YwgA